MINNYESTYGKQCLILKTYQKNKNKDLKNKLDIPDSTNSSNDKDQEKKLEFTPESFEPENKDGIGLKMSFSKD